MKIVNNSKILYMIVESLVVLYSAKRLSVLCLIFLDFTANLIIQIIQIISETFLEKKNFDII